MPGPGGTSSVLGDIRGGQGHQAPPRVGGGRDKGRASAAVKTRVSAEAPLSPRWRVVADATVNSTMARRTKQSSAPAPTDGCYRAGLVLVRHPTHLLAQVLEGQAADGEQPAS